MSAGRISGVLALLLLCGCGGGAAAGGEPATAEKADEPAETTTAEKPAPKSAAGGESPAPAESEEATVALEGKDLEAAMQALLSDQELLDKLHLKQPGRSPLKVSGEKLPAKLEVIAASHNVKVVPEPKSKKEAVLVFTKVERTGTQAKLYYRYDIEGLEGRATLNLKDGRWELSANRVFER